MTQLLGLPRLGWLLAILALAIAALVWTRTSAYWPLGE